MSEPTARQWAMHVQYCRECTTDTPNCKAGQRYYEMTTVGEREALATGADVSVSEPTRPQRVSVPFGNVFWPVLCALISFAVLAAIGAACTSYVVGSAIVGA